MIGFWLIHVKRILLDCFCFLLLVLWSKYLMKKILTCYNLIFFIFIWGKIGGGPNQRGGHLALAFKYESHFKIA